MASESERQLALSLLSVTSSYILIHWVWNLRSLGNLNQRSKIHKQSRPSMKGLWSDHNHLGGMYLLHRAARNRPRDASIN